MEVRNPELKKIIMSMDNEEAHGYIAEQLSLVKERVDDNSYVTLINGTKETVKVKEAIGIIHDDVKEQGKKIDRIQEIIEFLSDFNRLHKIFKKYNLYWLAIGIISLFFSHNVWQPILLELIGKL